MKNTYQDIWAISEKQGGEKNVFDFLVYRRVATALIVLMQDMKLTPNAITSASIIFSFIAGFFLFQSNSYVSVVIGVIFLNVSLICDTMDGQWARLKNMGSEFGAWYDSVSDCLKYVIISISLTLGAYYNLDVSSQWLIRDCAYIYNSPEFVFILGLLVIANFFMVYFIHGTRYRLSFNAARIAKVNGGFYFGIESTLYAVFTVFLLAYQIYWLLIVLAFGLPALWIYPFYLTYKNSQAKRSVS